MFDPQVSAKVVTGADTSMIEVSGAPGAVSEHIVSQHEAWLAVLSLYGDLAEDEDPLTDRLDTR